MRTATSFPHAGGDMGVDLRKHCSFVSTCDLPAKKRPGKRYCDTPDGTPIPQGSPVGNLSDNDPSDENCTEDQPHPPPHTPMDSELQELIQKYVRADYVVHCLELAGFDSLAVFSCLTTETTFRQLELFVGATCALMSSANMRLRFLGPLYASHPRSFKLPAGVVCGLRLAVEELRRTRPYLFPSSSSLLSSTLPPPAASDAASVEACAQTELSIPVFGILSSSMTPSSEGSPQDPSFANAVEQLPPQNAPETPLLSLRLLEDCKRHFEGVVNQANCSSTPCNSPPTNAETIDIDRLIHHSSASACRLAARQFVNANIVRGQHFDMEMEVTACGTGGQKRVTGIFFCHLCREKRERTCAVRFSVARNRYPVMSNVLSHLKTHFRYQASVGTGGVGGGAKRFSMASPPPPVPPLHCGTSAAPPSPFLSPTSFCNLMSRVAQFAATANSGGPLGLPQLGAPSPVPPLPSALPAAAPLSSLSQEQLSPVN